MELESSHRAIICGALLSFCVIVVIGHLWRSTKLEKGFSEHTIKMHIAFVVFAVFGVVAISGVISGEAIGALLGGAAGYTLGNKPWEGAKEE